MTGHTGFKGSWLSLWLQMMGADVTGFSLPPATEPNHWNLLNLEITEYLTDIRDGIAIGEAIKASNPEIVFHLAAQSLVRHSYRTPLETWETNVMGSVHLMEACRDLFNLKAIVFITTDKCYENKESPDGYTEDSSLGGHDPYSASKASAELVAASYRDSFFKSRPLIATARAGNVIGGGDWAQDRLVPDLARAQAKNEPLIIRSPNAVRPWQHVLEPLCGYLQLGEKLLNGQKQFEGPWNFGPAQLDAMSVSALLNKMGAKWKTVDADLHETQILLLNSQKAHHQLKWNPILTVEEQIAMTAQWYNAFYQKEKIISRDQLEFYQAKAMERKAAWI